MGRSSDEGSIQYKDIKDVKISNWLLGLGKGVQINMVNNSKLKIKINKTVIGARITKQSENLKAICSMLETKFI